MTFTFRRSAKRLLISSLCAKIAFIFSGISRRADNNRWPVAIDTRRKRPNCSA